MSAERFWATTNELNRWRFLYRIQSIFRVNIKSIKLSSTTATTSNRFRPLYIDPNAMLIFHSVVTRFAGFIFHTWAVAVAELGAKVFVITIFSNTKHGHTEHTNAYMELPFYCDKLINVAVYRQLMQLLSCLCVSIDCFGCEASTANDRERRTSTRAMEMSDSSGR